MGYTKLHNKDEFHGWYLGYALSAEPTMKDCTRSALELSALSNQVCGSVSIQLDPGSLSITSENASVATCPFNQIRGVSLACQEVGPGCLRRLTRGGRDARVVGVMTAPTTADRLTRRPDARGVCHVLLITTEVDAWRLIDALKKKFGLC